MTTIDRVEKLAQAATTAGFADVTVIDDGGHTHLLVSLPDGQWKTQFLNLYVDMAGSRLLMEEIARRYKYDHSSNTISQ